MSKLESVLAYIESDNQQIINAANQIVGGETNPYLNAQSFYYWIIDNMYHSYVGDDLQGALFAFNNGFGECGEYAALFAAFCRASGIPARPIVGFWALEGRQTHVWAEFYLQDIGWLPVDATVADDWGDPNYYFGNLDNDRLIFSIGYNVILEPPSIFNPVSLFQIYCWEWYGSGILHDDYYLSIVSTPIISDEDDILPAKHILLQNYPNPFNGSTTINYGLKQSEYVLIDIYDLLGRKIERLIQHEQPAGNHHVIWNAKDVSTGIYFYRIQAGDFLDTKKMLLLK